MCFFLGGLDLYDIRILFLYSFSYFHLFMCFSDVNKIYIYSADVLIILLKVKLSLMNN